MKAINRKDVRQAYYLQADPPQQFHLAASVPISPDDCERLVELLKKHELTEYDHLEMQYNLEAAPPEHAERIQKEIQRLNHVLVTTKSQIDAMTVDWHPLNASVDWIAKIRDVDVRSQLLRNFKYYKVIKP